MISLKLSSLAFLIPCLLFSGNISGNVIYAQNRNDTIKIGLLIQDNKSNGASDGATMAIIKANKKGASSETAFSLVIRSMEGSWGTGSKQAASLVFDDKVAALIGSHDGRNAHLAEQVATRVQVPFLSVWSGDPTLAQAFVPWYFSCTPNNNRQSDALIKDIFSKNHFERAAFISDKSYDSKMALKSFELKLKEAGKNPSLQLFYDWPGTDFTEIMAALVKNRPDCIILSGEPSSSKSLVSKIHSRDMNIPLYGTLTLLDDNELKEEELSAYESCSVITSGHWFGSEGNNFRTEFYRIYGYKPGAAAAYAYDGARIIIEAIRNAGTDREKIQAYLAGIKFKGVTGEISFDAKGNRKGSAVLMKIRDGIPVLVSQ
jgi:branched-chain amino acid transport system substrate-binding protein